MGFRYLYVLNGEDITEYVSIGQHLIEKLEEPLDEATTHLPFTLRGYEYEMRGLLEISVKDYEEVIKTFAILIYNDEVSEGSKYGEWIHNISYLEYSHKYDNYQINTLTITKPTKSDRLAPFQIVDSINSAPVESSPSKNILYKQPPVQIKETYEVGSIKFKKTIKGRVYDEYNSPEVWRNSNVYLSINASGNTKQNITENDVEFIVNTPGDYTITMSVDRINFLNGEVFESDFIEFYVRIVDRNYVTVKKALEIIRDIKPFESLKYHESTRLFNIDTNIIDFLDTVEIPQQFIQKATMRQVLNSIFLYVNAISRAIYVSGQKDTMSMDEFNKINDKITLNDVVGYKTSQSALRLFNKSISWLEQSLPDDLERASIKTPSENLYKTIRSKDIQIKENNFVLPLERKLYELKKIEVVLDLVTVESGSSFNKIYLENFVLDLTSRVFNKDEWQLKRMTNNFPIYTTKTHWERGVGLRENMAGTFYWEQGSNRIDLSVIFGEVVQQTLLRNIILEGLHEYFTLNPIYNDDFRLSVEFDISPNINSLTNNWFRNIRFNVEYITLENITIQTEKDDISYNKYYTEGRINQGDKRVNTVLMSRKLYGDIQRMGVPNITVKKIIEKFSDLYELGDITSDGYIITQRKFEFQNEFIEVIYNLTKDHNRLSERIDIDTQYRAFEIPESTQVFQRQEIYSDYLYITKPTVDLEEEHTKVQGILTKKIIFGVLNNDWLNSETNGKTKVTLAYVKTDGMNEFYGGDGYEYGITTPVTQNGVKQGLAFTFGFENNQVAGDSVFYDGLNYYNNAVRYTNSQGKFDILWFELSTKYRQQIDGFTKEERLRQYPLIRTVNKNNFSSVSDIMFSCGSLSEDLPNHDPMVVLKDSSQSFKMTYQISIMSYTYLEYIIGQYFYTKNFLVENPTEQDGGVIGEKKYIYLYHDGTRYGKFNDLKIINTYTEVVEINNTTLKTNDLGTKWSFYDIDFTDVTSWAIGDIDKNLYLACNYPNQGFNVFKKHFRVGLEEIGNKEFVKVLEDNVIITDISIPVYISVTSSKGEDILIDDISIGAKIGFSYIKGNDEIIKDIDIKSEVNYVLESGNNVSLTDINIKTKIFRTYMEGDNAYIDDIKIVSGISEVVAYELPDFKFIDDITIKATLSGTYDYVQTIDALIDDIDVKTRIGIDYDYEFTLDAVIDDIQISTNISKVYDYIALNDALIDDINISLLVIPQISYEALVWVEGGVQPTTNQVCLVNNDVGNVRCDVNTACIWNPEGSYLSSFDETSIPNCSTGEIRIVCELSGPLYLCQISIGQIETTYSNCETCSIVEG